VRKFSQEALTSYWGLPFLGVVSAAALGNIDTKVGLRGPSKLTQLHLENKKRTRLVTEQQNQAVQSKQISSQQILTLTL
jgi:hypothetical protein